MPVLRRLGGVWRDVAEGIGSRQSGVVGRRGNEDLAGGGVDETGDHAEERGLAAAGGPEEEEELAGIDVEGDVVDGGAPGPKDLVRLRMEMAVGMAGARIAKCK
jgi:hypothetical protein